jgi:hypothetical protein
MSRFLLLAFLVSVLSFRLPPTSVVRTRGRTAMSASTGGDVCVVGLSGGVAETVACKLVEAGATNVVAVLDRKPCSPVLLDAARAKKVQVVSGELSKPDQMFFDVVDERGKKLVELMQGRTLVAVNDDGDGELRGTAGRDGKNGASESSGVAMEALLKALQPSLKAVVLATGVDADKKGVNLFGKVVGGSGPDAFRAWCKANNKPFSLLRYGTLTGGVPGAEPLPFVGLPLLEPELHPSYTLRAVVLTGADSNQYAATEVCTRGALGEAAARAVARRLDSLEALVVSIAGAPPSEREWDQLFTRMTASSNVELLRIDFGAINKPQALTNWLADVWFPQALIEADAATILRGARPVRAVKVEGTGAVQIKWEDIQPDLSVKPAGGLEIRVQQGDAPALSVVRLSQGSLPGEMQLMDKLVEGVNKNVYKRQLCTPVDAKQDA